ncbi:MAG: alpha/beta hydrolase [Planctomycetes bacterium]|nr:alpha/beta hydrolase [Planctomycetota bacterium]
MSEVRRAGRTIHYEDLGTGEAVLLVPGLGSGAQLFGTLPRRFARAGFRCITFDPVGVPPSSPHRGPYDFPEAARDVLAVLDAAGVTRGRLLGTSLGGKVAVQAAALAPERVSRMVLLASSLVVTPRARAVYRFFATIARELDPSDIATAVAPFLFGRTLFRTRPELVADILRWFRPDEDGRALMVAQAEGLQHFAGESLAAGIQVPVLCVAGAEDTLTCPDEVEETARLLPRGRYLCVAGAGHSLLLESPATFDTLLAFLREA